MCRKRKSGTVGSQLTLLKGRSKMSNFLYIFKLHTFWIIYISLFHSYLLWSCWPLSLVALLISILCAPPFQVSLSCKFVFMCPISLFSEYTKLFFLFLYSQVTSCAVVKGICVADQSSLSWLLYIFRLCHCYQYY